MRKKDFQIGVISDTHGLLRPEAEMHLKRSNLIIHAGDIGDIQIIISLKKIAPVYSVKGNIDTESWAAEFPGKLEFQVMHKWIFVIHDIKDANINNEKSYDIIISGHSHKPLIKKVNEVLFLNPGSAGKKRFSLPVSLAQIYITEDKISARIIELKA